MSTRVAEAISRVHREEWARVVAALARRFGDLDIAEDAAAEAFAVALERWPLEGVPPNPGAWLTTTANRKAIDRYRRESKRDEKQKEAHAMFDDAPPEPRGAIDDDVLRLLFTCCHPALAPESRVALTLRMVGGLTVPEIAKAFLVQEAAMGRRITRAKDKIKAAHIPYTVPEPEDLPLRVSGVLAVLFLVFNEGYLSSGATGSRPRRPHHGGDPADPTGRRSPAGRRRGGRPAGVDAPHRGAAAGAGLGDRRAGPPRRAGPGRLGRQLLSEGHALVRSRLEVVAAGGARPGRYQILAAINAVHTSATDVGDTDWSQVVALYDQLVRLDPSPIVALNRAIAIAELDGPEVALAAVDRLDLDGYHAFHAARADLLRRVGRTAESRVAYGRAIELAGNAAEIAS